MMFMTVLRTTLTMVLPPDLSDYEQLELIRPGYLDKLEDVTGDTVKSKRAPRPAAFWVK